MKNVRKILTLGGLSLLSAIFVEAQPTPALVDLGTYGQAVIYVGPHHLAPGTGTNAGITTVNIFITTNNVDYITSNTNTYVTVVTNVNFLQNINVSGKGSFTQIVLTNGFFAATNVWGGPSNTVDISIYDQEYGTLTPVNFSGIINSSNSLGGEVKMTIGNTSSSNITVTAAAGFVFASGDTSETITNGHRGIFWINQDPALGGQTNVVFQHF